MQSADTQLIWEAYKSVRNGSVILEKKLSTEQRERLEELIAQFRDANDPSGYYDYANDPSPDEIIETIRREFDDKIADEVDSGSYIMHFPRDNNDGPYPGTAFKYKGKIEGDPMHKHSPRITKAGKINATDAGVMKRRLKELYGKPRKPIKRRLP